MRGWLLLDASPRIELGRALPTGVTRGAPPRELLVPAIAAPLRAASRSLANWSAQEESSPDSASPGRATGWDVRAARLLLVDLRQRVDHDAELDRSFILVAAVARDLLPALISRSISPCELTCGACLGIATRTRYTLRGGSPAERHARAASPML